MGKCRNCNQCKYKCNQYGDIEIRKEYIVALAGNPNVGKSTVFNELTGLKQHTGNWPGKTVANARGNYDYLESKFEIVDLPGTYSLFANSVEEEIARDFICFEKPDVTIVVIDATALERNLNLVLQVLELTDKVVICLNLIDEAKKKGLLIDIPGLENELGVPVVGTIARDDKRLEQLKNEILLVASGYKINKPKAIKYNEEIESLVEEIIPSIEELSTEINSRWLALRIVDGDYKILSGVKEHLLKVDKED